MTLAMRNGLQKNIVTVNLCSNSCSELVEATLMTISSTSLLTWGSRSDIGPVPQVHTTKHLAMVRTSYYYISIVVRFHYSCALLNTWPLCPPANIVKIVVKLHYCCPPQTPGHCFSWLLHIIEGMVVRLLKMVVRLLYHEQP
jgi:hypothetical protein